MNGIEYGVHGFIGGLHLLITQINLRGGGGNERMIFFGSAGRTLGQITHFRCHYGKTTPLLARAASTAAFKL